MTSPPPPPSISDALGTCDLVNYLLQPMSTMRYNLPNLAARCGISPLKASPHWFHRIKYAVFNHSISGSARLSLAWLPVRVKAWHHGGKQPFN